MRILDRYIARAVLGAMALVLLVLGGLDLLFTAVDELGSTNESYQSLAALQYVLLTWPRHLYELLPMTALIGALSGLGLLASGNELVVMQASGVSVLRIVGAVMKPALLVMLFGLVLGEYIAPTLELRAEVGKSMASGEAVGLSRYGHWERDGDAYLHFNSIDASGVLFGVSMLVFDAEQRIVRSVEAEQAVFVSGASAEQNSGQELNGMIQRERMLTAGPAQEPRPDQEAGFWLLQNGKEIVFSYGSDGSISNSQRTFTAQNWVLDLTPDLLKVLIVDTDTMAMSDLYRYAQRFERQGQDASSYYLSFWKKTLQPLATAILVLVAVSFIFGPLRSATMGSRVFTGICFGLTFTILQRLLHNFSLVYQQPALLAVLLPLLLIAVLGLLLFRKAV